MNTEPTQKINKYKKYQTEYALIHKDRLNRRSLLSYHNRVLKMNFDDIHEYEKIHGLENTILWLKMKKLEIKMK